MLQSTSLKHIPHQPGCYILKDREEKIIYIGKAKDIKKRLFSYLSKEHDDVKTAAIVDAAHTIDYIVTDNEVEALLLEAQLIQRHKPKYNVVLKDSTRYAYLKVTNETFPRIITTRKRDGSGRFYGPFPSGKSRHIGQGYINRVFKLRVCKKLPKKACLLYSLGQCSAPCIQRVNAGEYKQQVQKAELLLKGSTQTLLALLEKEMKTYAKALKFEQAQERKEQIQAIRHLTEKQKVDTSRFFDQHVINAVLVNNQILVQILQIHRGVIAKKDDFRLEYISGGLESFLRQYYLLHAVPEEVILPKEVDSFHLFPAYLSRLKGSAVSVTHPQRGYKQDLLRFIKKNIECRLVDEPLLELQNVLSLKHIPREIDAFDISNIAGRFATGSCVRFSEGKPNKQLYRHFRIKTVQGSNDVAMLYEVLQRRYKHCKKTELPNLLLIDGGRGQLNAARRSLHQLHLQIPVIALAKKLEEIYITSQRHPLRLNKTSYALHILQRARDEAHRFAVKYHTHLRDRAFIKEYPPKNVPPSRG